CTDMPQTLMAFLAMTIAALATLNQMTSQMATYDNIVHSEYQLMANAEVIERMEIIALGTDYDDLDALDGSELSTSFSINEVSVNFDLEIVVQFVDEDGEPSVEETDIKEVAITAFNDRYALPLVTHRRMFSE